MQKINQNLLHLKILELKIKNYNLSMCRWLKLLRNNAVIIMSACFIFICLFQFFLSLRPFCELNLIIQGIKKWKKRQTKSEQCSVFFKNDFNRAVERSEHFTTIIIDKLLLRFSCACINILEKNK